MLKDKTIVLGVCGGIAAYKAVDVVSRLKKLNANVIVIMTDNAQKFVSPLTFMTISGNKVFTNMFDKPTSWEVGHVSLAQKADLFLVVPATANIIGKVANGIADDMLSTTLMAARSKVVFAPAMNCNMYVNSVVQSNIKKLKDLGYGFIEPDKGLLACGVNGVGRLANVDNIVKNVSKLLSNNSEDFKGVKVLITAGPTREPIDVVRYISNHSSGKMGYSLATRALDRGARVKIISGPVSLNKPDDVEVVYVQTACDMYKEVMDSFEEFDIIIMVAAVADYRSANVNSGKIKKTEDSLNINLVKNPDIAAELGKKKGKRILVGFAAEAENLVNNSLEKIKAKNLDIIVANDITMEGAGFNTDTNAVKIIDRSGNVVDVPKMSKEDVADVVLDEVIKVFNKKG